MHCPPAAWACGCSPARGARIAERELIPQTHRGRAQGRTGPADARAAGSSQATMAHRDTAVSELCRELGIRPVTLYRYVGPQGQLREQGQKVLAS